MNRTHEEPVAPRREPSTVEDPEARTIPMARGALALRSSAVMSPVEDEAITTEIARPSIVWTSARGWRDRARREPLARWRPVEMWRARRPPLAPGLDVVPATAAPPRWVPLVALAVCVAGIVGLTLPLIEAVDGVMSFSTLDIPYVGMPLMGFFVLVTLLPVRDVARRQVRWTAWLVVPALVGALPVAVLFFALSWVPRVLHAIWAAMPDRVVEIGSATAVLVGSDVALVVVGVLAVVVRVRARRARRRARTG